MRVGVAVQRRTASALRSLRRWPDRRGWLECLWIGLATGAAILLLGLVSGLLRWDPAPGDPLLLLARVLLVPSLWEEFVFRGLLSPARGDSRRPALSISVGLAIFVGWHVVLGLVVAPAAAVFLDPRFLLCAGLLGLACALMRYRTGSLWPAVACHAVAVWAWQGFLGGPSMAELAG